MMSRVRYERLSGCCIGLLAAMAANAKTAEAAKAKPDVAATIGSKVITLSELDAKVLNTNMKLAQSLYSARQAALEDMILERALASEATAKGKTVEQIIRERIAEKSKPVTNEDIKSFYDSNKARLRGRTLEQSSGQIRNFLTSQRQTTARKSLLTEIKKKNNVRISLNPPRVNIAVASNDPVKGSEKAKVTIVEFSDFQ